MAHIDPQERRSKANAHAVMYRARMKESGSGEKKRYDAAYHAAHREELSKKAAARYAENREKRRAKVAEYQRLNAERITKQRASYRAKNRERLTQINSAYYAANWGKAKAYRMAHRADSNARKLRRKALMRGVSVGDPAAIRAFYRHVSTSPRLRCCWCRKVTRKAAREVDHVVPIAKGGAHSVENLCCSCSKCNHRKGAKLPEEFNGQYRLGL